VTISDIHGNLVALQATLAALCRLGVDQLICLGDVALFGPNPKEVIALLRDLACSIIMGNTDDWALNPQPFPYRNAETSIYYEIELWGAQQLATDELAFLRTFMPTIRLEIGQTQVLCYHGSPRSYDEGIFATTPDEELAKIFTCHSPTIALGGHTHTQMVRRYREMLLVNPGSVGAPFTYNQDATEAYYPPWAEYGVIEIGETAQGPTLQVHINRTPVDVNALIAAVKTSGMPHAEWYLARWQRPAQG
jgi:putative phosphoesterase